MHVEPKVSKFEINFVINVEQNKWLQDVEIWEDNQLGTSGFFLTCSIAKLTLTVTAKFVGWLINNARRILEVPNSKIIGGRN